MLLLVALVTVNARGAFAKTLGAHSLIDRDEHNIRSEVYRPELTLSNLYYDQQTRRFHFAGRSPLEGRSIADRGSPIKKKKKKKSPGFFEGIMNFLHSTFVSPFFPLDDRKPPKRNKVKHETDTPPKKQKDLISDILDDLDDMFRKPFREDSVEGDDDAGDSGWFSWFDDDGSGSDERLSDQEKDEIYEDLLSASGSEAVTTVTNPEDTAESPLESNTPPIPSTTTTTPATTTKTVKTTTVSRVKFVRTTRATTKPPPRVTTRRTIRIWSRRPNVLQKNPASDRVKDCKNVIVPSWASQLQKVNVTATPTTSKPSSSWFNFFTSDENDQSQEINSVSESSSSWFGGLFNSGDDDIKVQAPETTPSTVTPTSPATESSWFNSIINVEDDDGAYALNTTKKGKKSQKKNYKGFQLIRIYPGSTSKMNDLKELQEGTQGSGLMWWSSPALNKSADVLVPPDLLSDTKDHLNQEGYQFDVIIWDLQKAIAFENQKLSKKQRLELEMRRGHPLTWRRYHRYVDILRYMEYLSLKYPDIVELIPLGRSYEGLPLIAAKVSMEESNYDNSNKKKWKLKSRMKPAVWIDGGVHAREWISPAVATWFLHSLVEGEKGSGSDMDLIKAADWYILPVINPDGYEYTHTKDRLWRKSRSVYSGNVFFNSWFPWSWGKMDCYGVDLNRNWDYHWGEKGSSNDRCSDYYAGPKPFSEPETKVVSNFIAKNKDQIKVYLTLHAYSQMWVVPSTHTRIPMPDEHELMEMGKLALNALKDTSGTKYEITSLEDIHMPATGTSYDWAKGRAGVKYSYGVKLRDATGPYGYLLPGSEIIPTAKETWEAIKAVVDNL